MPTSFGIIEHDGLEGPWEEARGPLARELSQMRSVLQKKISEFDSAIAALQDAEASSSSVLDTVGQLDFNTTNAEETLYSYTVPGNTLGTTGALRLFLGCDYLNNTGAGRTLRVRVKYGATTLYDDTTGSLTQSATRRPFYFMVDIGNTGTTNSQFMLLHWSMGNVGGTTAGLSDLSATVFGSGWIGGGSSTEDSTADKDLTFTIQMSTSDANHSTRRQFAWLHLKSTD